MERAGDPIPGVMAGDLSRIAEGIAMKSYKITIAVAGTAVAIAMAGGIMAANASSAAHLVGPSQAAAHSAYAGYIGTQTNSNGQVIAVRGWTVVGSDHPAHGTADFIWLAYEGPVLRGAGGAREAIYAPFGVPTGLLLTAGSNGSVGLAPVGRQGVSLSQLWTASPFITSGGGAGYTLTNNGTGNILQISSSGQVSDPAPVPINASSLFTFDS
jgi:hypothetical protein